PRPERGFFSGAVIARAFGVATRRQLGGISVQHPVTRRRHLDNEQKSRDAQFAPKNGQNPKPSTWPADRSSALRKARNHPPRPAYFFNLKTSNSELGGRASGEKDFPSRLRPRWTASCLERAHDTPTSFPLSQQFSSTPQKARRAAVSP